MNAITQTETQAIDTANAAFRRFFMPGRILGRYYLLRCCQNNPLVFFRFIGWTFHAFDHRFAASLANFLHHRASDRRDHLPYFAGHVDWMASRCNLGGLRPQPISD